MVHLDGKVVGPWPVKDLRQLRGFTVQTLVSYPDSGKWAPAFRVFNMNSYEPPVAAAAETYKRMLDWTPPPTTTVAAFDWKAPPFEAWSDRWFRRLAIFNTLLVIAAFAAWHSPAVRLSIQKEVRWEIRSPAAAQTAMLGRSLLVKGTSSLRFVLPKFVRELHKIGFPLPRNVHVNILKPEV